MRTEQSESSSNVVIHQKYLMDLRKCQMKAEDIKSMNKKIDFYTQTFCHPGPDGVSSELHNLEAVQD
uniref:Uncharacterized protein n=1 Tax=Romanomermis culicivorax TaxID=13658 RepID=A0A915LB99_ROMCU